MMKMINCLVCGKKIDNPAIHNWCPHCKTSKFMSDEDNNAYAEEFIDILRANGVYDEFEYRITNKDAEGHLESISDMNAIIAKEIGGYPRHWIGAIMYAKIRSDGMAGLDKSCKDISETGEDESITPREALHNEHDSTPHDYKPFSATADKKKYNPNLTPCSACNHQISKQAETCPNCGHPTGVHVCPYCKSVNTKVISGASKATSIFMWGVFAANKVVSKYQCRDCGHKW